jgi:hypothetical protein
MGNAALAGRFPDFVARCATIICEATLVGWLALVFLLMRKRVILGVMETF